MRIRVWIQNQSPGQGGPDPGLESGSGQEWPGSGPLFLVLIFRNFVAFNHLEKGVK
jgi:hypothetical protein